MKHAVIIDNRGTAGRLARTCAAALLYLTLMASCSPRVPLSLQVVASEMARSPEASYLDGQQGKLKWNYTTGLELKAFLDVYERYNDKDILTYVENWYDSIIDSAGAILKYKLSNYSTDHICPGRTLFSLYDLTGRQKYRLAMDTLYSQLQSQPRTPQGGFWHTRRYVADPGQQAANYADIAQQFLIVAHHTFDAATGLYRHAWDASRQMFWCDPVTGQSDHAWGRALGWYMMALVDVLPLRDAYDPEAHHGRTAPLCRSRNGHVVSGAGPPGRRRQLCGGHRQRHVYLCYAQGLPAGLSGLPPLCRGLL